jgi:DNA-binding transcriptional LysR family regulator
MDIRQMRYFLEICKFGSISQAANSLFISQQGLSSAIRRLEQDLGCDLFYRKGNSLVLTEQGQYFLDNAGDIVSSFDKLQNHFRYFGSNSANHLFILCVYSIISKSPPALQKLLLGGDSDIELSVGECYSDECPRYLENDECNFAICYELDRSSRFEVHRLFQVEHCFVVYKDHPLAQYDEISLSQLQGTRMIMPESKTAIRSKLDELFNLYKIRPTVVLESNQALQICNLIVRDHSLVARITLADALAVSNPDIKILRIKDLDFSTYAVLAHRKDRPLSMVERLFHQEVLDAVQRSDSPSA